MGNPIALAAIGAALVAVAAAPAYGEAAAPRPRPHAVVHAPALHVLSLCTAYLRAVPHASAGQIAGVVTPRGERLKAPPARHNRPAAKSRTATCPTAVALCSSRRTCNSCSGSRTGPAAHLLSATCLTSIRGFASPPMTPGQRSPRRTAARRRSARPYSRAPGRTLPRRQIPPRPMVSPPTLALASQRGITDLADAQIVVASRSGTCPDCAAPENP